MFFIFGTDVDHLATSHAVRELICKTFRSELMDHIALASTSGYLASRGETTRGSAWLNHANKNKVF